MNERRINKYPKSTRLTSMREDRTPIVTARSCRTVCVTTRARRTSLTGRRPHHRRRLDRKRPGSRSNRRRQNLFLVLLGVLKVPRGV